MRTIPHRVPLSRRHVHGAVSLIRSATDGAAAATSPRASTGAATDRGPNPPSFAAPVLIHHSSQMPVENFTEGQPPSVILLDGPPGTPFVWHRVLPLLRSSGLRPRTVKQAAYPGTIDRTGDQFKAATDIAQLLVDLQQWPAVIVGHGAGSGVALALAATTPNHVRALVLAGPTPGLQTTSIADRLLAVRVLGPAMTCLGFRLAGLALHLPALRRRVLTNGAGLNTNDAKYFVREITFGTIWRTFVKEQRRLVDDAPRRNQQLAGINCPVLILSGARDRTRSPRCARALRRLLPGAEVIATAAAGHLIPLDDPHSVTDAVLRALRRDYRDSLSARPRPSQSREAPKHRNRDQP
jgi:pimeloyl-ACP methyl ester carboxylesterase